MKKIKIDEFSKLKSLSSPEFSPNGENLCFVLTEASIDKDAYISWIYCMKDGAEPKQVTFGGKETGFSYLDDNTIIYAADQTAVKTVFNKINLNTGKITRAFSVPLCVSEMKPLKNGKFLFAANTYPGYEDMFKGDTKAAKTYLKEREAEKNYEEFSSRPWWADGGTFTRGVYTSLYSFDAAAKEIKRLTPFGFSAVKFSLTPDKKTVFISGGPAETAGNLMYALDLYKMNADGSGLECIHPARPDFAVTACVPGNEYAVVLVTDLAHGSETDCDFYKMSYEDHKLTLISKWDRRIESTIYSDVMHYGGQLLKLENDVLYFTSTVDEEHPVFKLEDGEITRINSGEGDVRSFDVHDGKMAIVAQFDMKAQEIYGENGSQLTHFNDKQLKGKYVAKPERLTIDSEGREIRGFVYKPIDYKDNGKYPAIMFIHGGPKSDLGPVFFNMFQYWTSEGYFVFCCDPYGSDGRGSVFGDICGEYFTNDYADLMNFCDAVLEKYPQIDRDNLFETGISYGGIMTNWIISHNDRFTACVSQASISNLLSFGVSDIGTEFVLEQFKATPWTDPALLWEKSPLKYADKVKTPTLFINSLSDYRCPIDQGLQMYAALKSFGVDTRFFMIRGESHTLFEIGSPVHKVRYVREITRWFEEHKKR